MVNLILQPVFLNLVKGSTDHKMTSDDLYNMWSVASRAKSAIVQGRRLENLSWRLWYTSTIRAKVEMEQKRNDRKAKNSSQDYLFNLPEEEENESLEEEDNSDASSSSNNNSSSSSSSTGTTEKPRKKRSSLILPSDKPLFTSTCTSILAEIQDASFRYGQTGGGPISANLFSVNNVSNTINNNSNSFYNGNNLISPPNLARARSSLTSQNSAASSSIHSGNNGHHPKRKKNVEKFLKKFKSNLEDISELFDEKLGFTDEETNDESVLDNERLDNTTISTSIANSNDNNRNESSTGIVKVKTLSPTNSSATNHFATDEEGGQDSSFYLQSNFIDANGNSINLAPHAIDSKIGSEPSLISKLFKKRQIETTKTRNRIDPIVPVVQPLHQNISVSNFGSAESDKIRELMEMRSPRPPSSTNNHHSNNGTNNSSSNRNLRRKPLEDNHIKDLEIDAEEPSVLASSPQTRSVPQKRILIDATALSTSLSSSQFRLENEFDSQLVIW